MINETLDSLSLLITQKGIIAPAIAFIAGVVTSFTPCSLSSIPLIVGYMGSGSEASTRKSFFISVVFAIGMAVTFTTLGFIAAMFGRLIGATPMLYILLGILMIAMAFQVWGVVELVPSSYLQGRVKRKGYFGAFLVGVLAGFFSSPCATPVLVALLGVVAKQGEVLWGVVLLFFYSAGHSVLVIITGTSMGAATRLKSSSRYHMLNKILNYLLGTIMLLAGLYILYLGF